MQGEVSWPALWTEQGSPPAKPPPPWGWAQGALTGTHKHRTLPLGRWAPYMQTMLNMQLWGPPWGPSAHPSSGDGPPAVAGLRLLGHGPHLHSLAYHPPPPTQHGTCFSLASSKSSAWAFLPFFSVPSQELPLPARCPCPFLALHSFIFDSTCFCVLPQISHNAPMSHKHVPLVSPDMQKVSHSHTDIHN